MQGFVKGAYGAAIGTILGACILLGRIAVKKLYAAGMLLSAIALLVVALLIVLGPLLFKAAAAYVPALAPLESHYDFARFGVSGVVVVVSLFILHMWLPAGRRGFGAVWPGIHNQKGMP